MAGTPMSRTPRVILGSSSKTRQGILKEMGYEFTVMSADIDERSIRKDNPEDLVMALAEAKADCILQRLKMLGTSFGGEPAVLITADQVVLHEGVIREKPLDEDEARLFIEGYSRSPASTISGIVAVNLENGLRKGGIDKAEIYFHPIPKQVVEMLIKEGSVFYAAGGLLVEHPLVSPLVEAMVGSLDSVMGLPKDLTTSLIQEVLQ